MKAVVTFIGGILLVVLIAQIESCNKCESSGGVYVKTVYGTHTCIYSK